MLKNIFYLIQNLIDLGYKKKIKKFFNKELKSNNLDVIIDVGAHKGETINFFEKFINVNRFYCYEASTDNFISLQKKIDSRKKKNFEIFNLGIGYKNEKKILNKSVESQASTINKIDPNAEYTLRKIKFLKFFFNFDDLIKNHDLIEIVTLKDEIKKRNIVNEIDILKIDTEGYEYNVLIGLGDEIRKINLIYFEHHFDQSIIKNYKFSDIHQHLIKHGFKKAFKIKMPMRKVFDYVYIKNSNI